MIICPLEYKLKISLGVIARHNLGGGGTDDRGQRWPTGLQRNVLLISFKNTFKEHFIYGQKWPYIVLYTFFF